MYLHLLLNQFNGFAKNQKTTKAQKLNKNKPQIKIASFVMFPKRNSILSRLTYQYPNMDGREFEPFKQVYAP